MKKQRSQPTNRGGFQLDPKAIRITTEEIRADLLYPAAPGRAARRP